MFASGAGVEPFIVPQYVCSFPNRAITAHSQPSRYLPQVSLWRQIADALATLGALLLASRPYIPPAGWIATVWRAPAHATPLATVAKAQG